MDNLDKKVIDINYPCIQDVVIRKDETDVCFTITDGQDETKLFLKDGQGTEYDTISDTYTFRNGDGVNTRTKGVMYIFEIVD